ncbi:MAG: SDR family oxidoreductase [Candidatus Hodarchaeota archaeon]
MAQKKPILVTGASSGIGRMVTEFLSRKGHLVYACARKESDIKNLNSLDNVISFRLDVTKPDEVLKVVDRVKKEEKGLYAIVNNAGISDHWPILETDEEMLNRVFDVNVYGPLRITNALFSFLIESKGRIVNISSVSGLFTPIFAGTYSMSKHALEAWSNALSQELKDYNVKVSIIEPGNFKTNIFNSTAQLVLERFQQPIDSTFKKELEGIFAIGSQADEEFEKYPSPEKVANAVMDALFNENPKTRYLVINDRSGFAKMLKHIMIKLSQVFQENEYGITKEELHKLLDTVL